MKPLAVVTLALAIAAAGAEAPRAQLFGRKSFSFRQAALMPTNAGEDAAMSFVRSELPAGIPLGVARARLKSADMSCGATQAATGETRCAYYEVAAAEGGTIGEDWFTVVMRSDPDGRLVSARVRRTFYGAAPRNSD